ncbi:MAG: hypothetical protein WD827_01635 [Solirubrobacterales bacterium]
MIDDATLEGVESANLDLSVDVKASGDEGGDIAVSISGPFQSLGKGEIPELDMTAKVSGSVSGEDIDFDGGLVLFPNSAFLSYQGTDYEVDPTTFSFVESALKRAQKEGNVEEESATACQEALAETDIGNFVDNLSNDGGADVDGTSTTKISGDLDVGGALDAIVELSEDPACSDQLGAVEQLPSGSEVNEAKEEVESALKSAHADLYVGDDNIIRRISAQLTIEPEASGEAPESIDLAFDLTLGGVNEDQDISAPEKTKPLSDLFIELGVNPIELLGILEGEGEGLENLLEGLGEGSISGGSSGGLGSYGECLKGVTSAADLQKCATLK